MEKNERQNVPRIGWIRVYWAAKYIPTAKKKTYAFFFKHISPYIEIDVSQLYITRTKFGEF